MALPKSHQLQDPPKPTLGSVAVVGAGVSGLAAAYRLKAEGVAVTVFEAESTGGGKLKSFSEDGFIWEKGANTMTESGPEVSKVIDELQLRGKLQYPALQNRRYIVRDGRPELLPSNPLALISSKLLSAQAKINIILEPLLWKRKQLLKDPNSERDESVREFLERHVGHEAVEYLVDPFVAGTSGSDPDSLSMRHAFPEVWNLENRYGSLIIGAIKSALEKKKANKLSGSKTSRKGSFSFFGGMQTLIDALAGQVAQNDFRYNATVLSLACNQQGNPLRGSWKLSFSDSSRGNKGKEFEHNFDAVIMTAPLSDFEKVQFSQNGQPYSLNFLPKVIYQPLSVLVMAFKKENVKHALNGFGVLVPSKEQENGFQTLGTIFSSSMFPDRAPADTILFTSFIGGSRNRELASRSVEELKDSVVNDLNRLLGVLGQPIFLKHIYWSRAFPQYGPGYDGVLNALQKLEQDLPGFYYAGNHKGGLAVGKALASGYNAAGEVLDYLHSSGGSKLYTMAAASS